MLKWLTELMETERVRTLADAESPGLAKTVEREHEVLGPLPEGIRHIYAAGVALSERAEQMSEKSVLSSSSSSNEEALKQLEADVGTLRERAEVLRSVMWNEIHETFAYGEDLEIDTSWNVVKLVHKGERCRGCGGYHDEEDGGITVLTPDKLLEMLGGGAPGS